MGQYYQSSEEFCKIHRAFYEKASQDPVLVTQMRDADIIMRIDCFNPIVSTTIHIGDPETKNQKAFTFEMNDVASPESHKKPHAVFSMSADFNHSFWSGREDIGSAIIGGKVRASGNYLRPLALIPEIRPIFRTFRKTLEELQLDHLIISK